MCLEDTQRRRMEATLEHTVSARPGAITIGIPTRNRSRMLLRAVQSALTQTYTDLEIVVSDNASDDDTVEQLRGIFDARLVVLRQPTNIGMVGNFDACLRAATGELFLMLSDDDVLERDAIELLSRPFFGSQSGLLPSQIGATWCPCTIITSQEKELWKSSGGPIVEPSALLLAGLFNGRRGPRFSSVMVRTADAIAVGGYNEARYGATTDTANWGQVALLYEYAICIDRPLVRYTNHGQSETSQAKVADWRRWSENLHTDLCSVAQKHSPAHRERLERSKRDLLASITLGVLIQKLGRRTGVSEAIREVWRSSTHLLRPFLARRIVCEGWKLFRLRKHARVTISSDGVVKGFSARFFGHVPSEELVRYLMVGTWNTVFGYCSFALFVALLDPLIPHGYIVAMVVSSLVNITISFLGYKLFVFRTKGRYLREWLRCLAVYSGGIAFGAITLPVVVEALRHGAGLHRSAPYIGGAVLTAFGVVYNFFGHKKVSFRS